MRKRRVAQSDNWSTWHTIEAHDIQLKHIRYNWSTWHSPIGPQGPVASLNYLCVSRTLSIQVCIYKCHPMSPTLCIYCRQLHWSSAKEKSTIERQFKHITRPHDSIALEQPQLYKSSTLYMSTKCTCHELDRRGEGAETCTIQRVTNSIYEYEVYVSRHELNRRDEGGETCTIQRVTNSIYMTLFVSLSRTPYI